MIIIKKPDTSDISGLDAAFIVKTINDNKKYSTDSVNLNDDKIREIFYSQSTRICIVDGEYIGFCFLSDIENKLSATFHGYISGVKAYYTFKKLHIFDLLFIEYFKNYDILTINVFLPEYLESKKIGKLTIKTPAFVLLSEAGFKIAGLVKNWDFKNKKPVDIFIFQVHKFWFSKWQKIKADYELTNISVQSLANKHKVGIESLTKIIKKKNWLRSLQDGQ